MVAADGDCLSRKRNKAVSELSRRAFVVGQNFSNCRRKVIDARTRHDDAIATAMGFFGDAQESPALIFSELHVEMLTLNLQFSRLDDVIHFYLRPSTLPHPFLKKKKNRQDLWNFLYDGEVGRPAPPVAGIHALKPFDLQRTDTTMPLGCGACRSSYNFLRVFD
jgi:hypothetical protein